MFITERERVKMSILAVTIAPIRLFLVIIAVLAAAIFSAIANMGIKVTSSEPLPESRQKWRIPAYFALRIALFGFGKHPQKKFFSFFSLLLLQKVYYVV